MTDRAEQLFLIFLAQLVKRNIGRPLLSFGVEILLLVIARRNVFEYLALAEVAI